MGWTWSFLAQWKILWLPGVNGLQLRVSFICTTWHSTAQMTAKKTSGLNGLDSSALLTCNHWEQVAQEIAAAVQSTSPWNGSLCSGKRSSHSRIPASGHFPCHGKGAGGLRPGCMAGRRTHCCCLQHSCQEMLTACSSSTQDKHQISFWWKCHLQSRACLLKKGCTVMAGQGQQSLAELASNLSLFTEPKSISIRVNLIVFTPIQFVSLCFTSPRKLWKSLPMGIPRSRVFWRDVFSVGG